MTKETAVIHHIIRMNLTTLVRLLALTSHGVGAACRHDEVKSARARDETEVLLRRLGLEPSMVVEAVHDECERLLGVQQDQAANLSGGRDAGA